MKTDLYNPVKKYNIIYADPPWNFKVWSKKGQGRSAEAHYSTMGIEEICALPVSDIAAEDCCLFMWATFPLLKECFEVIEAWGFQYKTCAFTWVKQCQKSDKLFWGMGYWTRSNAEVCLLATKGKPKRMSASVHSVIMSNVREHSRKPDEARGRIVQLCGDFPRIEVFARQQVDGWDCWGNEV